MYSLPWLNLKIIVYKVYFMKRILFLVLLVVLIMLVLPFLIVQFVESDAGMAVIIMMFFIINPVFSVIIGAFSARNIKTCWWIPLFSAATFLLSSWLIFESGEPAFIAYSLIYSLLGYISIIIKNKTS